MKIIFKIGDSLAEFRRDPFLGRAHLIVDGERTTLASLADVSTSFSFRTLKTWKLTYGDHIVEIDKNRPQMFGGLLPNAYVVKVDGKEITAIKGY